MCVDVKYIKIYRKYTKKYTG